MKLISWYVVVNFEWQWARVVHSKTFLMSPNWRKFSVDLPDLEGSTWTKFPPVSPWSIFPRAYRSRFSKGAVNLVIVSEHEHYLLKWFFSEKKNGLIPKNRKGRKSGVKRVFAHPRSNVAFWNQSAGGLRQRQGAEHAFPRVIELIFHPNSTSFLEIYFSLDCVSKHMISLLNVHFLIICPRCSSGNPRQAEATLRAIWFFTPTFHGIEF